MTSQQAFYNNNFCEPVAAAAAVLQQQTTFKTASLMNEEQAFLFCCCISHGFSLAWKLKEVKTWKVVLDSSLEHTVFENHLLKVSFLQHCERSELPLFSNTIFLLKKFKCDFLGFGFKPCVWNSNKTNDATTKISRRQIFSMQNLDIWPFRWESQTLFAALQASQLQIPERERAG